MARLLLPAFLVATFLPVAVAAGELECGLSIGSFDARFDHDVDFSTSILELRAEGSFFKNGPGLGARVRATFGLWDNSDYYYYYDSAETLDLAGFDVQVLAGWTFQVDPDWRVTPLAGLSYRSYSAEYRLYDYGDRVEYDFDMLSLDVGMRLDYVPDDVYDFGGSLQFTVGPILSGRASEDYEGFGRLDGDVDGGVVFECRLATRVDVFCFGLSYEYANRNLGGELDRRDEHQRFAVWIGLALGF